jgi:glutathione synthase/RimK-type ligase-like ATP-grasp enzyme/tetratricopeptide (TPR) repeat protein
MIGDFMPGTPATSRELRDQALSHHRSGNLGAAIAVYESLLREHPDDADCLGLLAMALHQSGQPEAARSKWLLSLTLPADPYIQLRNLNNLIAAGIATGLAADAGAWTEITVPDWPAERRPAEAEKDLVISLGRALLKIGKRAEAVRLIDSAASFVAGDLIVARNFAEILIEAGQPDKAHRLLADIAGISPREDGERLLALAATAYAAGLEDEAARLTKAAIAALPIHITPAEPGQQFLIGVVNPAPPIVTQIMSPQLFHFSGNSPASLAWRHNNRYRFWSVFPEAPEADQALERLPRPQVLLNNWVNGERLSTPGTLDSIAGFVDRLNLPVLNHPRAAAAATRQRNAERLAGIPGLVVPRVARFRNEPAQRQHVVRSIAESFGFPVIIRNTYMQAGKEAEKIVSAEALADYLSTTTQKELYAIEFIDNPVGGRFYRKIRAAIIGGEVVIAHVHFGERWNVHRERDAVKAAELAVPAADEAFAHAILFKPHETLGRSSLAALNEIAARIPLDFYGIDFDIMADGRLVFFEANAAMNVSVTGRKSKGVEPIRARMRETLHRLLERTAAEA